MDNVSNKKSLRALFTINNEYTNEKKDTRFLNITIDVLHTGLNYNGSIFTKEVVNENIDSIKNTAVLGFIDNNGEIIDFTKHEYKEECKDGKKKEIYLGHAYGVVPESCNPRWITKLSTDGIEREYLQVDALLWTKFDDACEIFNRDIIKNQSMEIELSSIEGVEDEDNGIFTFTKFKFDGCCLLSTHDDNIQPAMIDSQAKLNFTTSIEINNIFEEIKDKLKEFTQIVKDEGGNNLANVLNNEKNKDFALTYQSLLQEVNGILSDEKIRDSWGDLTPRYFLVDIQDNEVIVSDTENHHNLYGIKFSMDGDKPVLDFAQSCRKKVKYENYEEGVTDIPDDSVGKIINKNSEEYHELNDKFAKLSKEYTELETQYKNLKSQYDILFEADEKRKQAEVNKLKEQEFSKYQNILSDVEEFKNLKDNMNDYSLEDIENKCAIMYAKKTLSVSNFSRNNNEQSVTLNVMEDNVETNYVSTKYGNIPI